MSQIISQGMFPMANFPIRLLRNGQMTLPAKIRHLLGLEEGAFLEADVKNNHIVLTPKTLVEPDKAKEEIGKILKTVWERNKNLDPDEVQQIVDEARAEVRAK